MKKLSFRLNRETGPGKRMVMFSYGSGLASSMFSWRLTTNNSAPGSPLDQLLSSVSDLKNRLDSRIHLTPEQFDGYMKLREDTHNKGWSK